MPIRSDGNDRTILQSSATPSLLRCCMMARYGSQKAFAEAHGKSEPYVSLMLSGKRKVPAWALKACGIDA